MIKTPKRKQQPEFEFQKTLAQYLCVQYPKVLFLSDMRGFLSLTFPQANRSKSVQKPEFLCPDLILFSARRGYHGLFLELKAESPFKKNGELKSNPRLEAQAQTILDLQMIGYFAEFAWDFDETKILIDWYLSGEPTGSSRSLPDLEEDRRWVVHRRCSSARVSAAGNQAQAPR